MDGISKSRSSNLLVGRISEVNLKEENQRESNNSWNIRKRQRFERKLEDGQTLEKMEKESSELFSAGEVSQHQLDNTHLKDKVLTERLDINNSDNFNNLYTAQNAFDPTILSQCAEKYIAEGGLDNVWQLIEEGGGKKNNVKKLGAKLAEEISDGAEMDEILTYVGSLKSHAEIHLILVTLLADLKQRDIKPKLQQELVTLINQHASQQASYLFEYFSILKNPKLAKIVQAAGINNMAKLNAGNLEISGLRQIISFVDETFNGQYENVVSLYIGLQSVQIGALKTNNREAKTKFIEFYRVERYLILAHSIHSIVRQLLKKINEAQIKYEATDSEVMLSLVTFCSGTIINDSSISNLLRSWKVKDMDNLVKLMLVKALYAQYSGLAMDIFANEQSRQKFGVYLRALHNEYIDKIENVNPNPILNRRQIINSLV